MACFQHKPSREKYEFVRNLPAYADSLIADLTYPLAWGNSDVRDFGEWKQVARQKVFDCMLTPPRRQRAFPRCQRTSRPRRSFLHRQGEMHLSSGLRRWLDYPHIASIACPKAMLFINGSQDKLFPVHCGPEWNRHTFIVAIQLQCHPLEVQGHWRRQR